MIMRDYGKVSTSFWSSEDMKSLTDDGRLLALYLLTCGHTSLLGLFRLPDGYVSEDIGWSSQRVTQGFDELFKNGFATRDSTSKWVFIHKFLEWNPLDNPNQGIAALKLFSQIPDKVPMKVDIHRILMDLIRKFDQKNLKGYERVLEQFRNQEQEQEQEQKQNITTPDGVDESDTSDSSGQVSDKKPDKMNYQAAIDAYHEILPAMSAVVVMTDKRKRAIRCFWKKFDFNQTKWEAYLGYISNNCQWMTEDRPNGKGGYWKAKNLDYLVTERCYVSVKEMRANDR
jgi:hypothetical protein